MGYRNTSLSSATPGAKPAHHAAVTSIQWFPVKSMATPGGSAQQAKRASGVSERGRTRDARRVDSSARSAGAQRGSQRVRVTRVPLMRWVGCMLLAVALIAGCGEPRAESRTENTIRQKLSQATCPGSVVRSVRCRAEPRTWLCTIDETNQRHTIRLPRPLPQHLEFSAIC